MIGGGVLRRALATPAVGTVTTVGRRRTGMEHSKLREVEHANFADCKPIMEELANQDVALFCLGAYTGTVPDAELRRITVDYVVGFAETLVGISPNAAFCLLSGQGADQTEKSRIAFAKYKGAAEKSLLSMGFPRVHLFRPGYIYPVTPRPEHNLPYRVMRMLYPAVRLVWPNVGIPSDDLANVMLEVGLQGTPGHTDPVLENRDLRALATTS